MIIDPKSYQSTRHFYIYIPLRIYRWICPDIDEYFRTLVEVRNYAKSESLSKGHPEHEMKYFFKVLAKEPKKWWPYEHTRFFKYPRWNSGTVPVPEYKDELGYKLGTGKKIVT